MRRKNKQIVYRKVDGSEAYLGTKYYPERKHFNESWSLPASVMSEYSQKYPVFIETGSYVGGGIAQAIGCGFKIIHSIEIDDNLYEYTDNRYHNYDNVSIYHGSSTDLLSTVLKSVEDRAVIFLDAHWWGEEIPLQKELEAIKQHHIKDHIILIDDIGFIGRGEIGPAVSKEDIEKYVLGVNPDYTIRYVPNKMNSDNILIAEVKNG